eukprot:TRINITY_DN7343_c0_g1_i1.p1 TRINITY_DN7343_c0_g1~~TRINITY_DN7343_c0_g1_i1.p1  ORF type:complete len:1029 (+),score=195.06 TRINITY_DN7343_c0_g1_i1:94-3180(+)
MSRLSEYQVRQYERVFRQFCTKDQSIGLSELSEMMPNFGAQLSEKQLKHLMYTYDTRCDGQLNFDDTLALLADYEQVVQRGQLGVLAYEHLAGAGIGSEVDPERLLALLQEGDDGLSLEEIEMFFGSTTPQMPKKEFGKKITSNLTWFDHRPTPATIPEPLTRQISIRIFQAFHLSGFARVKTRNHGMDYATLDPYITVSCGGVSKETSVLIGEMHPEWNQELQLTIKFPSNNFYEVQYWIEHQRVTFTLFDYEMASGIPHSEWLGSASLPLSTVLRSVGFSRSHLLRLSNPTVALPHTQKAVELEVSIQVNLDGVVEHFLQPMESWARQYYERILQDLSVGLRAALPKRRDSRESSPAAADLSTDRDPSAFGTHMVNIHRDLSSRFPTRYIQLLGIDEYNVFRPLPCFLTPIKSAVKIADKLAAMVAGIPTIDDDDVPDRKPALPCERILPTFQTCSPSLMMYRGNGTVFEHALLLCDLLLGMGLDAYVCLGGGLGTRHAWVITIRDPDLEDGASSANSSAPDTPEPDTHVGSQRPSLAAGGAHNGSRRMSLQPEGLGLGRTMSQKVQQERLAELKRFSLGTNVADGINIPHSFSVDSGMSDAAEFSSIGHPLLKKILDTDIARIFNKDHILELRNALFNSAGPKSGSARNLLQEEAAGPIVRRTFSNSSAKGSLSMDNLGTVVAQANALVRADSLKRTDSKSGASPLISLTPDSPLVAEPLTKSTTPPPQLPGRLPRKKLASSADEGAARAVMMFRSAPADAVGRDRSNSIGGGGRPSIVLPSAPVYDPSLFKHRGELEKGPGRFQITHYESTTGKWYIEDAPYERAWCVFNNKNMWANVQRTDILSRLEWDLSEPLQWVPILMSDIRERCGPLQCCYGPPPINVELPSESSQQHSKRLVHDVAVEIQAYRQNELGAETTYFHRAISKAIHEFFDSPDKCTTDMMLRCEQLIENMLPPHSTFSWRQIHVPSTDVDRIMKYCTFTRLLDCTLPDIQYVLAVRAFTTHWNLTSCWVFLGYVADASVDT